MVTTRCCLLVIALPLFGERLAIDIEGKPFTNLYYGAEWAKPFLHPLRAASGTVVTRGYPVEKIEGENQDHVWHHGLWWTHGAINGVDFWRDKGPASTGRIEMRGQPKKTRGAVSFNADLVAPGGKALGSVRQEFRFARAGTSNVVDAAIVVLADRGVPLELGDTEEGTFGLRLADEFREERGVTMTNSAGATGRAIWGKRAQWVDYSTAIRGERLGVLVLDHPSNPKHPTYWHARHYSLNAANPFGEHDFLKDKTRNGGMTIPAGGRMEFRYRVVIHAGGVEDPAPGKLFDEYARERRR